MDGFQKFVGYSLRIVIESIYLQFYCLGHQLAVLYHSIVVDIEPHVEHSLFRYRSV